MEHKQRPQETARPRVGNHGATPARAAATEEKSMTNQPIDGATGMVVASSALEFRFNERAVRTVVSDGQTWFVASDVCAILEHTNPRMAVSRLDDDERGVTTVYTPGRDQEMNVVNESGLYALILTSRKPQAKSFRRWVTAEVIPSIRKTGHYTLPGGAAEAAPGDPKTARVMLPDYGRYVITHRPGGIFLHQTGFNEGLPEVTATDCQILSHTLLLIDGYWQKLQYMRAMAVEFPNGYFFAQLEKAILEGAKLGKHCLEFHPRGTH